MRDGFYATGAVRLTNATIGGSLDCENGRFSNPGGNALLADRIDVTGDVFLCSGFKAEGTIRLLGATIGGSLVCNNSNFINPDGYALLADRIDVTGDVFLSREFRAEGGVRLRGATIGGDLSCITGHFSNPNGMALDAFNIEVKRNVLCQKFRAEGTVDFTGASVGLSFHWRGVEDSDQCTLSLESAKVGTLWDEAESWPAKLYLDGLVYDRLDNEAPTDSDARLRWLARQGYDEDQFVRQPYVQLAKVLQEMGHEADARRILIAKQKDPARVAAMNGYQRLWHHLLGQTIGYGYRPWQAGWWIAGFITLGTILFRKGPDSARFQEIGGKPPAFNTFVCSLDSFVPLVDFHQAKYRLPTGRGLRAYHWLHIALGWFLTSLVGFALTRSLQVLWMNQ